ncbi:MAG TPA: hypothetical protein VFK88_10835 [Gallionella sp.]|nr:hypothetical protein [Gallionella sp.]
MCCRSFVLAVIAFLLSCHPSAWAGPPDDMRALLEQNRAGEAYQLGRAHPELLGEPAFDFFYGIAALDAGRTGEGVLALERYILTYPNNRDARFQLARGYFILGEDQRARDEFEALLPNSAGSMRTAIDQYLAAIRTRESRYQPSANLYLEAGVGVDTNINAGLSNGATPQVPGLGSLPPISSNSITAREQDSFMTASGGVQGIYPVSPGVSLSGGAGFDARQHFGSNNDIFDQKSFGFAGGASFLKDKQLYKVDAFVAKSWVDNQGYVASYGLNGEWNHQFDQFNRFTLSLQAARFNYYDMFTFLNKNKAGGPVFNQTSVRGSDFAGVSAAWSHAFVAPSRPVVSISGNYGEERNRHDRPDLSRNLYGVRAALDVTPSQRWGLAAGIGYQDSKYRDRFTVGSVNRHDEVYSADGSAAYFYTREFSVRAEAQYSEQKSNIGLLAYNRAVVAFKARYEFK